MSQHMNNQRNYKFTLRLSKEEKQKIHTNALKHGIDFTALLRRYLDEGLKRDNETLNDAKKDMLYLHFETMQYARAILEKLSPDVIATLKPTIRHNVNMYIERYYHHDIAD